MAGQSILNPIRIHSLTLLSPSLSRSSLASVPPPRSPLWEFALLPPHSLAPSSVATSPSAPPPPPLPRKAPLDPPKCDLRTRFMSIPNLNTTRPSIWLAPPQAPSTSGDSYVHASPAISHRPSHPAPPRTSTTAIAMHSPLTPTYAHKTALLYPSLRPSPGSLHTMTFVAPVPRPPLASVLRHLDASWARHSADATPAPSPAPAHAHTHTRGADAIRGTLVLGSQPDAAASPAQLGLGLMLGAACVPIRIPRPRLEYAAREHECAAAQDSQPMYSRRLRSIAPPPLELATPTPVPRAPLRTVAPLPQSPSPSSRRAPYSTPPCIDVPPGSQCSSAFALDHDLDLDPGLDAVSVSPQSARAASESSMAAATQSTAPTSLLFPGDSDSVRPGALGPGRRANPTHVDPRAWQRAFPRSLDAPLSPLLPLPPYQPLPTKSSGAAGKAARSPRTPSRKSSMEQHWDPFTPGLPPDAPPPPLRRTEWVPLPELPDDGPPSSDAYLLSPLRADLRLDLGVEDLALRAEQCAESVARASLSLCSCSLLRDPGAIVGLCDRLRATFLSVQQVLDGTPAEFPTHGPAADAKRVWYAKHWQVISSLDRNLNLFYLLTAQIEQRPPRIHRLASLLDKLSTYRAKFADLARRIALSHEKLRFLSLRTQLSLARAPPGPGGACAADEREPVRRHADARAARQEGRARRREIREELVRVRGRIRAIRERAVSRGENGALDGGDGDGDGDVEMGMGTEMEKKGEMWWR